MADVEKDLESPDDIALADKMNTGRKQILAELHKRIIGQHDVMELVLQTLFVGGNSLIIGVPGLAKTLLIQTLAQVLELKFTRIQFTPDLMPSDITGTDIIQEDATTGRRQMVFAPGPIFSNIVLADEINRTPPKTQSALLEAMQEHRVTIQGRTYQLDEPFYVFATQNPIELEGTYPAARSAARSLHVPHRHRASAGRGRARSRARDDGDHRSAFHAAGERRRTGRVPAAGPPRAGGRSGVALRAVARAHEPAEGEERAGVGEEVGGVRRQRPRRAVPGARREGARADQRPLSRQLRRHQRDGASGACGIACWSTSARNRKGSRPITIIDELLERVPVPASGM